MRDHLCGRFLAAGHALWHANASIGIAGDTQSRPGLQCPLNAGNSLAMTNVVLRR